MILISCLHCHFLQQAQGSLWFSSIHCQISNFHKQCSSLSTVFLSKSRRSSLSTLFLNSLTLHTVLPLIAYFFGNFSYHGHHHYLRGSSYGNVNLMTTLVKCHEPLADGVCCPSTPWTLFLSILSTPETSGLSTTSARHHCLLTS